MEKEITWQQRIRIATGLSCWQIMLHSLVIGTLIAGWVSGATVHVGLALCALYAITLALMLACQRHHARRWRAVGDVLEELTTAWYFGAAIVALWLLSHVLHSNLLLTAIGLAILAGPTLLSLLAKARERRPAEFVPKQPLRR